MTGKNLRLLGLEQSPLRQPTMEEIIAQLRTELAKGAAVYTKTELEHLARKLTDYEFMLQRMISS